MTRMSVPQTTSPEVGVDLFWLPLGAGGRFVRVNGQLYEVVRAFLERRPPCDLYHSGSVTERAVFV